MFSAFFGYDCIILAKKCFVCAEVFFKSINKSCYIVHDNAIYMKTCKNDENIIQNIYPNYNVNSIV